MAIPNNNIRVLNSSAEIKLTLAQSPAEEKDCIAVAIAMFNVNHLVSKSDCNCSSSLAKNCTCLDKLNWCSGAARTGSPNLAFILDSFHF